MKWFAIEISTSDKQRKLRKLHKLRELLNSFLNKIEIKTTQIITKVFTIFK